MKIAPGTLHKYLTGETVTGDDASIATNINKVFDAITTAHNDTDDKVTADVSNLTNNYYTKPQTDTALGVRDTNLNNYKIETATNFGIRDSAIAQLSLGQIPPAPNTLPIPVSLGNGLQVVNVGVGSPYNVLNIVGRTLVNLLGRDGNCEDVSKWTSGPATIALDATNKVYGSNSIKLTSSGTVDHYRMSQFTIQPNKYYVLIGEVKPVAGKAALRLVTFTSGLVAVQTPFSATISDTTKFNLARVKVASGSTEVIAQARTQLYNAASAVTFTAAGENSYFDGIRAYEVTLAEYNAFDALTDDQIAVKYPYVDDVKHVNAPYVIKYGENLLPSFNEWTIHANAKVLEPYKIRLAASALDNYSSVVVPAVQNTQYTLSGDASTEKMESFPLDKNGVVIAGNTQSFTGNSSVTFTTPSNTAFLEVHATNRNNFIANVTFNVPMLNLGATVKPFKSRNDDSLFFPNTQLASSVDGLSYDQLFKRDGKYFVERRVKDMVLDGSLAWIFSTDKTGYKVVDFNPWTFSNGVANSQSVVKYDGKILSTVTYGSSDTASDQCFSNGTRILISIADTDSGWGETYTPTAQEIQAYFYGYVMYLTAPGTPYNGTGTKSFGKRTSGGSVLWVQDTNAPTVPATAYGGVWNNYKLTYQLATATFEEIQVDAGMSLHEGLNQLEVGQAVQVREKVTPLSVGGNYLINHTATTSSAWLKNRTNRIVKVFKNGIDNAKAVIASSNAGAVGGGAFAYILPADFDPTATYEVVYIASDQYLLSAPVQTVNGEVASNLKTVVDALSMNDADQDARITANELLARQIYNVPKQTTQAITLYVDATNGADNNDGSAGKPFKTIQRAVNNIPQVVNHAVTINVAAGTYAEDITMFGFVGGASISLIASGVVNINSFTATRCTKTSLNGFTATTTSGAGFSAANGGSADFIGCITTVSALSASGFGITNQKAAINTCTISNRQTAIYASTNSEISCDTNTGSGNTNVYASQNGGKISTNGTQPTGTVMYNSGVSGGVVNPWGDNTAANRSRILGNNNATQSINAATATKVLFQVAGIDNLGEFVSSKFTAKSAGTYEVSGSLVFSSGFTASMNYGVSIYKNGAAYRNPNYNGGTAYAAPAIPFALKMDLVAGDYVEIYITTSVATVVNTGTWVDISRTA